jgi:hypothetical protein
MLTNKPDSRFRLFFPDRQKNHGKAPAYRQAMGGDSRRPQKKEIYDIIKIQACDLKQHVEFVYVHITGKE